MVKLNKNVPTHLAFTIILILSFILAWFTVRSGEKIIKNSTQSPAFNIGKRLQE